MKNDYIYKSTVGDIFMNIYNRGFDNDAENIIKTPIQTYLREAKHFYNLTVFKAIIETQEVDKSFMKLNAYTYPKTRRMCYWISEKDLKITLQDKKKGVTQYDLVGENIVRKKSNYFLKFNYYRCRFILNFIKNEQKRAHYIDKLERLKKTILLNAK